MGRFAKKVLLVYMVATLGEKCWGRITSPVKNPGLYSARDLKGY